jgi:L-2-hydroxyglutarate oxidase LhgO
MVTTVTGVRVVVVGAGIVGLATARELARRRPDDQVTVIDKEPDVGAHQTSHNSGVIHAGIYYPPGSLKAQLCRRGQSLLREFADQHTIPYSNVGKVVVAVEESELERLAEIHRRALDNGVTDARRVDQAQLHDIEPEVNAIAAVHSPSTAIIDYAEVARALARDLSEHGADIRRGTELFAVRRAGGASVLQTSAGDLIADQVVVCAGLQASRVAALVGDSPDPRIIPFRGEYYRLRPRLATRVNGLVYPVPNPRYPFLGVHLTRRIDGSVDIGPNAVLAFALEGYRRRDVDLHDLRDILSWPGFRRLARTHWRTGAREMFGSLSKRAYLAQARNYLPALESGDLAMRLSGVRAQAVRRNGDLVDDFVISVRDGVTLVRNAPSPAATSSLAIAEHIAELIAG